MYTLRIVEKNGIVSNHYLGNSYARIKKDVCKMFSDIIDSEYPGIETKDIDSLITGMNGDTFFIYKEETTDNQYFIMTDSGKTFERL